MTKMEQTCLYNILLIGDDFIQKYSKILSDLYEDYDKENLLNSFIGMYEIVMDRIASYMGNIGEYERSDAISKKIIRRCLINRRAYILDACIYNIVWNNSQRQKEGISYQKYNKNSANLYNCILLSRFCKTEYSEIFYKKKMESHVER